MNQRDVAREFGAADSRTIIRWSQTGRFPRPVRVVGTTRIFRREDVERFYARRDEDVAARPELAG